MGRVAGWIFGSALAFLLLVPGLLLPVSTGVPGWAWLTLLVTDPGLVVILLVHRGRSRAVGFGGLVVTAP